MARKTATIAATTTWQVALEFTEPEGPYIAGSFYNPSVNEVHVAIDGDLENYYTCPPTTRLFFDEDDQIRIKREVAVRTAASTASVRVEINEAVS